MEQAFTQNHETFPNDLAIAEQILGQQLTINGALTPERAAIASKVHEVFVQTRESLAVAVSSLGIEVSQEQLESWQPSEGQVERMRVEASKESKRLRMLEGLQNYTSPMLRDHQNETLACIGDFLENAPRNEDNSKTGYLNMATGTGKTAIFTNVAAALKSQEDPEDPIRVLVLSPTQQILRQTIGKPVEETDEPQGFSKFTPQLDPTAYYQNEKRISDLTIMTNASFNNLVKNGMMPEFDAVIIDETHTGLGDTIREALAEYAEDKFVMGVTATPDYDTERTSASLLKNEIHALTLPNAIRRGILAPVSAELRELNIDIAPYTEDMDREEYNLAVQKALFHARLTDAMPDIMGTIKNGDGVIVRCPPGDDVWFARHAAELLRTPDSLQNDMPPRKLKAVAIGGSQRPARESHLLIQAFNRDSRVEVLTYVSLINMGTDVPRAKLLVNLNPTASLVDITQAVGRITRPHRHQDGTSAKAKVIDYLEPTLGERQFSGLDVLGLRPPQIPLDWEFNGEAEFPGLPLSDVSDLEFDVYTGRVWTNEIVPDAPAEVFVEETSSKETDPKLTLKAAAEWLDMKDLELVKEYLRISGIRTRGKILMSELLMLEELHPELKIPYAQPDKHQPLSAFYKRAGVRLSLDAFARDLDKLGVQTFRLRDSHGNVQTYVQSDVKF